MQDPISRVDLNTASREELMNLPGINSTRADRILKARPYRTVEDLAQVKKLPQATLEALLPLVYVEEAPPAAPEASDSAPLLAESLPAGVVNDPTSAAEPAPVFEPAIAAERAPVSEAAPAIETQDAHSLHGGVNFTPTSETAAQFLNPEPVTVTPPATGRPVVKSDLMLTGIASSVVSIFLTLLIVIVLLLGLNGTLRYGRAVEVRRLQQQAASLSDTAAELETSLQALQTQVDALNSMGDRLTEVEQNNSQLSEDVASANAQLEDLSLKTTDLSLQIDALITRTGRFQQFLDGLRDLLGILNQPEVP